MIVHTPQRSMVTTPEKTRRGQPRFQVIQSPRQRAQEQNNHEGLPHSDQNHPTIIGYIKIYESPEY